MLLYRYFSLADEAHQIKQERKVKSLRNPEGLTYFTPTRYEDMRQAVEELSLDAAHPPTYRIGPIPNAFFPDVLDIPLQRVKPFGGSAGGGFEVATREPVWLFGLWNNVDKTWEL